MSTAPAPTTSSRGLSVLGWIMGGIGLLVTGIGVGRLVGGADVLPALASVAVGVVLVGLAVRTVRHTGGPAPVG